MQNHRRTGGHTAQTMKKNRPSKLIDPGKAAIVDRALGIEPQSNIALHIAQAVVNSYTLEEKFDMLARQIHIQVGGDPARMKKTLKYIARNKEIAKFLLDF